MNAEIICVGSELLLGDVINTNATEIANKLREIGINCFYHSVVGDNEIRLSSVFKNALDRSDIIIITGGLGPTTDDLSKEVIAKCLDLELVEDQASLEHMKRIFNRTNSVMSSNNIKQSLIPHGAIAFTNHNGTAPGIFIEYQSKLIFMLPGVPHEMRAMLNGYVVDVLQKVSDKNLVSHQVYCFGIGESSLEAMLDPNLLLSTNPTVAIYAGIDYVSLRVTASDQDIEVAQAKTQQIIQELKKQLGDVVYSVDQPLLEQVIVDMLQQKNMKLVTAESCTGGQVSHRITSIAGSSLVFELGLVTYSNDMKKKMLKVESSILEKYGAVSPETVIAMVEGLSQLVESDFYVSISGIAGPSGGSYDKPVGLVYVALKTKDTVLVKELRLGRGYPNDRGRIQRLAATHALKMVYDQLLIVE